MISRRERAGRSVRMGSSGWIVGALLLVGVSGCGGPSLKPWHTEQLDAEFTADKSKEIKSFKDYLHLEDELFTQLQDQVYAEMPTGPEHALERYSAGSAADPQHRRPNWNRSFELDADAPVGGVLLLHGLTDSPYTFRALAQTLNARGFQVFGLRLPGHGTAPSGLASVSWEDMAAAVPIAVRHLVDRVGDKPIHVIGYSTGAPLAVNYTLDALEDKDTRLPDSLVLVSPAVSLHRAAALAGWKHTLSKVPGMGGLAWLQVLPEFDPYKYNSFPTNAAEQVYRVTSAVSGRLRSRARSGALGDFPPTLVFKSTVDATVSTNAVVDNLLARLAHERNELVLFDVNRSAVKSILMTEDPGPLTDRVMNDDKLPFAVTLLANENAKSTRVVARHKTPFSADVSRSEPLNLYWPRGVISLSHVALPFPPDDPLYGQRPPDNDDVLFLGEMAIQGERGMLKLPDSWLLRLRYNPFYEYMEQRVLDWLRG
ncbi:MAG: alpha/beta hydrolase [Gammaproteobacteria bacterium]|nr:alpha/beta hydrolase [Gammaproteobacteria bacterium]